VDVYYQQSPSPIDDADTYEIRLNLTNTTNETISDYVLELTYSPNAVVSVDPKRTFIDTVNSPYTIWYVDIVKRSDGSCRRISAESEPVKLLASETIQLRLEFTLVYK
jgi:hypothetical protein